MPKQSKTDPDGLLRKLSSAAEAGKKGNYQQAVVLLGELISEAEAPAEAWLLLGRSFHALKDYPRALAAFYDYIRQRPDAADGYFFAGRSCLAAGMPHKAVPFLRKALEKKSGPTAMALLGIAYLKSKNSQAAVEVLQSAVEAAPENRRIYRAYLNSLFVRGLRLCGIEDYDLGFQMLNFVLSNAADAGMSESTILRLELGRAARETGRLEEALEHFTSALKLAGDDNRIRWSRASVLMALCKAVEARKEIERIRTQDAGLPELPWNSELVDTFMIRSFLEAGEWRKAAASCRNWLKVREGLPIIFAFYAEALRNMQNYKTAHKHLLKALDEAPGELELWYASILVSWEAMDYKSLKKALKSARNLGGDETLLKRFEVLCQARTSEDIPTNITLLQDSIRSLGPEPETMYSLGEAYLKIGLSEQALGWFRKTINLKQSHEKAWLGEIAALEIIISEGALTKATGPRISRPPELRKLAALYKAYLEIWPDNSNIRRDQALFLVKTAEFAKAAPELEKLLAFEPSNLSLRRVLAYSYRKTGRYREAALYLKAVLKEKPKDLALLIEYSHCLDRAGAGKSAYAILTKARDFFKPNADLFLALGIMSFRQKDIEQALDCFREAAALVTTDPRPYEWMLAVARKSKHPADIISYYENEVKRRRILKKTSN